MEVQWQQRSATPGADGIGGRSPTISSGLSEDDGAIVGLGSDSKMQMGQIGGLYRQPYLQHHIRLLTKKSSASSKKQPRYRIGTETQCQGTEEAVTSSSWWVTRNAKYSSFLERGPGNSSGCTLDSENALDSGELTDSAFAEASSSSRKGEEAGAESNTIRSSKCSSKCPTPLRMKSTPEEKQSSVDDDTLAKREEDEVVAEQSGEKSTNQGTIEEVKKDAETDRYLWPQLTITPLPYWQKESEVPQLVGFSRYSKAMKEWVEAIPVTRETPAEDPLFEKEIRLPVGRATPPQRPTSFIGLSSPPSRQPMPGSLQDSFERLPRLATQQNSTGVDVQSPFWVSGKRPAPNHYAAAFKSEKYVTTAKGKGKIIASNKEKGTVSVLLENGKTFECGRGDFIVHHVSSRPDIRTLETLVTPITHNHGMSMLYGFGNGKGRSCKLRMLKTPIKGVKASSSAASAMESTLRKPLNALRSKLGQGMETLIPIPGCSMAPVATDADAEKIEGKGPTPMSTLLKTSGGESIPDPSYFVDAALDSLKANTFILPENVKTSVATVENTISIQRILEHKAVSKDGGLEPVFGNRLHKSGKMTGPSPTGEGGVSSSVSGVKIPMMCGAPCVDEKPDVSTDELVKAPGIVPSSKNQNAALPCDSLAAPRAVGWYPAVPDASQDDAYAWFQEQQHKTLQQLNGQAAFGGSGLPISEQPQQQLLLSQFPEGGALYGTGDAASFTPLRFFDNRPTKPQRKLAGRVLREEAVQIRYSA